MFAPGYSLFAVIPANEEVSIQIHGLEFGDESNEYALIPTDRLFDSQDGQLTLLRCNESDEIPNVMITAVKDGETLEYYPGLSMMDGTVVNAAVGKVAMWDCNLAFFLKSVMCGAIMYLAVELYRRGTKLGILLGVPLFIFCGFQHSIANVITMGAAGAFSWTVLLCALGNLVGALSAWALCCGVNLDPKPAMLKMKKKK